MDQLQVLKDSFTKFRDVKPEYNMDEEDEEFYPEVLKQADKQSGNIQSQVKKIYKKYENDCVCLESNRCTYYVCGHRFHKKCAKQMKKCPFCLNLLAEYKPIFPIGWTLKCPRESPPQRKRKRQVAIKPLGFYKEVKV